ncbi:hypothetical protein [Tropicimonas marinistellae]|uniref:hypothetical protein n=1 Tax=Tropicimonas marinistellae TaxID=1739787 RepID=UPI0008348C8C|nr:hypothetical protein [Tropicimonas marinistellae]
MADKSKTEAATDDTEKSVEDQQETSQTSEVETEEVAEPDAVESDDIEDAEVIGESPAEPDTVEAAESSDELGEDSETDAEADVADEPLQDPDPETVDAEDLADLEALDGVDDAEPDDPAPEPVSASGEEAATEEPSLLDNVGNGTEPLRSVEKETVVVERRGGLVPGFLGGAIATLGLAFAAPFVIPENMMPDFGTKALKEEITTLQGEIETLRGGLSEAATVAALSDLATKSGESTGALQSAVEELQATLSTVQSEAAPASGLEEAQAMLESMAADRDAFVERIDALEKRPIAEATDPASIAAVEAYGRELASLRAEVAEMMTRSEEMVSQAAAAAEEAVQVATSESQAAIAEAEAQEKAAAEHAARVARSEALVEVQAAIEAGEPFEDALSRIDTVEIPAALADQAADGVPTLAELQASFAPAARAALSASRQMSEQETAQGRFVTFLKSQSGIRSLAPRDGDSPDAVLSRAEAAAVQARLQEAIAEISTLPEVGQAPMADWVAQATRRAEAVAAADELAATLATN